jgi:hypothetical protein
LNKVFSLRFSALSAVKSSIKPQSAQSFAEDFVDVLKSAHRLKIIGIELGIFSARSADKTC